MTADDGSSISAAQKTCCHNPKTWKDHFFLDFSAKTSDGTGFWGGGYDQAAVRSWHKSKARVPRVYSLITKRNPFPCCCIFEGKQRDTEPRAEPEIEQNSIDADSQKRESQRKTAVSGNNGERWKGRSVFSFSNLETEISIDVRFNMLCKCNKTDE